MRSFGHIRIVIALAGVILLLLFRQSTLLARLTINQGSVTLLNSYGNYQTSLIELCLAQQNIILRSRNESLPPSTSNAYTTFDRAIQFSPNTVQGYIGKGLASCLNTVASPQAGFTSWLQMEDVPNINNGIAHFYLGIAQFMADHPDKARVHLSQSNGSWQFLQTESNRFVSVGRLADGIKWGQLAVDTQMNYINVQNLATLYASTSQKEKAIPLWQAYRQSLSKDDLNYWLALSEESLLLNDIPTAKEALSQGILRTDTPYSLYEKLGLIERTDGNWQQALFYFEEAIGNRPNYQYGYLYAGEALFALDDVNGARAYYEEALRLAPLSEGTQLRAADFERQLGNDEAALVRLQTAVSINPTNAQTYYTIATIQYATGHQTEAIDALKTAVVQSPTADWWQLLGDWYQESGQTNQADNAYQQADAHR